MLSKYDDHNSRILQNNDELFKSPAFRIDNEKREFEDFFQRKITELTKIQFKTKNQIEAENLTRSSITGEENPTKIHPQNAPILEDVTQFERKKTAHKPIFENYTLSPEEGFFILKGKLRLGKISPPTTVFFSLLIFPLFWPKWLKEVATEMLWHKNSAHDISTLFRYHYCALLPIAHFFYARKIINLLKEIELQHQQPSTSYRLSIILALFPPIFSAYIQRRINTHWKLHAIHYHQKHSFSDAKFAKNLI